MYKYNFNTFFKNKIYMQICMCICKFLLLYVLCTVDDSVVCLTQSHDLPPCPTIIKAFLHIKMKPLYLADTLTWHLTLCWSVPPSWFKSCDILPFVSVQWIFSTLLFDKVLWTWAFSSGVWNERLFSDWFTKKYNIHKRKSNNFLS